MGLRFSKMHGAGNDFVLVDLRPGEPEPDAALVAAIGDRHTGVGFDQLLSVERSARADCVALYRIWNSDGSLARQCGNGARCVAAWLLRDGAAQGPRFRLDSPSGVIEVECLADGRFALDMGLPRFEPEAVPMRLAPGASADRWTVDGAVVTLSGRVHSMAEHDAALGVAFSAHGVSRVIDHLQVSG